MTPILKSYTAHIKADSQNEAIEIAAMIHGITEQGRPNWYAVKTIQALRYEQEPSYDLEIKISELLKNITDKTLIKCLVRTEHGEAFGSKEIFYVEINRKTELWQKRIRPNQTSLHRVSGPAWMMGSIRWKLFGISVPSFESILFAENKEEAVCEYLRLNNHPPFAAIRVIAELIDTGAIHLSETFKESLKIFY